MQIPPYLKEGDKVGIISTARKISEKEVQPAVNKFQEWGLYVVKGKHLHSEYHQFAGTKQQRTEDLQKMLNDKSIKAIFCARGGYGTVQIIDEINWDAFRRKPKWIVGYSDITVLHSHLQRQLGVESIHATMPINFPKNGEDDNAILSLKSAIFFGKTNYHFSGHKLNRIGIANGKIGGGNLSILYSLLGSKSDLSANTDILFIEDLDEYIYHIDRMMMNMKRNGKFTHLKALIIGGMSDMNDNTIPYGKTAEEIIFDIMKGYNFPVCFNFPAGHIKDNRAIIMGRETIIEIGEKESKFIQY
jgi:muramoyltetrapeptide carboxypeptidase